MKDLISRQDAINVAQNYHCNHDITIIPNTDYSRGFYDGLAIRENDILQGLSELKLADVVQVCHCANCIHHAYDEITWGDLYKQFIKDYPNMGVEDYRPFVEGYLPTDRASIILWCKNGDVLVYMPKLKEK